ncbi:TIGR01777 family oxidoreductase [Hyalangium rubrum]|uniref:TIGR01777 family oxidoreductase n=1 Tax=Hyalangium rubrum TaxID=3103134 RepID=A0ABU5H7K9_9BACT|nr:TIGR01777 family oxidoreductase [Hyalangium sp. s54d21]MDY7229117.1 TIGR01777 family oxidoreductase [Hyalangium sp. s54d21]
MGKSLMFNARSRMPVPATELFAWHAREGALERLTPPWESMELVERTGEGIREGARAVVRVRIGPVSQTLVARHTKYIEGSLFQDTMESGPFPRWVHNHRMWPEPPDASVLEDDLEYQLPMGALGQGVGGGIARKRLERMFAYRHTVTREDLRRHASFASRGPLTVAVTGASGLVGKSLLPFLTTGGHQVRRMVRGRPNAARGDVAWDPDKGEVDTAALEGVDAVVHLAGENVAQRWTPEAQERIRKSRNQGTRTLCEALARMQRKPKVLVSAAAIGFYGDRGNEVVTEASPSGEGFLASVCRDWEAATAPAEEAGIRVVRLRIGVVLDARGGALAELVTPFKLGGGGRVGSGQQWFSWVSMEDVLGLIQFALFTPELRGPVNAVAPHAVRQEEFAKTLGRVLSRPAVMPLPAVAVRAMFGQMGQEVLLEGVHVRPEVAERHGYTFTHLELEGALRFTLGRTTAGPQFTLGPAPEQP